MTLCGLVLLLGGCGSDSNWPLSVDGQRELSARVRIFLGQAPGLVSTFCDDGPGIDSFAIGCDAAIVLPTPVVGGSPVEQWYMDANRRLNKTDGGVDLAKSGPYRVWFRSVALVVLYPDGFLHSLRWKCRDPAIGAALSEFGLVSPARRAAAGCSFIVEASPGDLPSTALPT